MTEAPAVEPIRVMVQSNRQLWTVCYDCGADVAPQIEMTMGGPRTVVGMCGCGFLTPGALVVGDSSQQPPTDAVGSEAA